MEGKQIQLAKDRPVNTLLLDSRKKTTDSNALFFAIKGPRNDGHDHIGELYSSGVRQFVIEHPIETAHLPLANIIRVDSSIKALQALATFHRNQFDIPVIGITGSNGKTIVKEWLFQLLSPDFFIAKNPGSYNSQIGVALSIWQLQAYHQMGVFEAGISQPGEMGKLANQIQPTIGLFTTIGTAHDEGFASYSEKFDEKLKLFKNCSITIYCHDQESVSKAFADAGLKTLSWGFSKGADIQLKKSGNQFHVVYQSKSFNLELPFSDPASTENILHCIAMMLHFNYSGDEIAQRVKQIRPIPMRLELKAGRNGCQLINDTYNNDLAGLKISLDFLKSIQQVTHKRLILSNIFQSGLTQEKLFEEISEMVNASGINSFVGVGFPENKTSFQIPAQFYHTTEAFLSNCDLSEFQNEAILIKGARSFAFEKIVQQLEQKVHGTVMEVNLGNLIHNLNYFKSKLKGTTKIMAMVKAFAYGSGSVEIANVLQYHNINYLGVAYADEGVMLRENNITIPIMVMNPSEESFPQLLPYNLEPEIYSLKILQSFLNFLGKKQTCSIHIKLDTGMHRLGFDADDLPVLTGLLKAHSNVKVASIFSHLSGADAAAHDGFSKTQVEQFTKQSDSIVAAIGYRPILHILNSPGALRLPQFQFDMIRLGIGLYGIDPTEDGFEDLKPVASLKTILSQIKTIKAGETVGYNRMGKAKDEMKIGVIAIGYADGFNRAFSNGVGSVLVKGELAPIVGNVCMDMSMVDLTGIDASEGDEVIIFGEGIPIQGVAKKINTIPYEILTNTSDRVKRVFVAESI